MPNKTIYVKDSDVELWNEAEQLAGESMSAFIADALRSHVAIARRRKELGDQMERITIDMSDKYGERTWTAGFTGTWLVYPDDDSRTAEEGWDSGVAWGVALTQKNRIAVFTRHVNTDDSQFEHYDSISDAAGKVPGDILSQAAGALGEDYVVELDI